MRYLNWMNQLYRHYAGDGGLLYVGISSNVSWRLLKHEREAPWWESVRTVTISEPFPTRADALEAESLAIENERPKFNFMHAEDGLLRRLKAKQRAAGTSAFASRVEKAAAMLRGTGEDGES